MKCPNPNCKKPEVSAAKVVRLPSSSGNFKGTFPAVAYCCGECETILGVESDPLERDAKMEQIKAAVSQVTSDVDVLTNRVKGIGLMLSVTHNPPK